jgi:hypothetical protein
MTFIRLRYDNYTYPPVTTKCTIEVNKNGHVKQRQSVNSCLN